MVQRLAGYLLPICLLFVLSCKKLSTKIDEPCYLSIPEYIVKYSSNYANGGPGTTNQKFTDLDVVVNGNNIGIYPFPCRIPVKPGSLSIAIKPVIKVNGVGSVRTDYAPIKLYDTTIVAVSGETSVIRPKFDYYPNGVTFYWVEDFEYAGSSLVGDTAIKLQTVEKFEGNKAVKIELKNGQTSCLGYSSTALPLPTNSQALYMEVNYKCNQRFTVGLLNSSFGDLREVGGANASSDWNKIYFFFSPSANTPPTYSTNYVYFRFVNDGTAPAGENPVLYLDNIKMLSQP